MDDPLEFGSLKYLILLVLLLITRGMDFLSTWIATPNLVLEGNPFARRLGWRLGIPVNILVCVLLAFLPAPAIVVATTSALVAARNFQSAWLMRSFGEHNYRHWHTERLRETHPVLFLFCLLAQVLLFGGVGVALVYFGGPNNQLSLADTLSITQAIGVGIVAYAVAVGLFTLLGIWKLRRSIRDTAVEA